MPKVNIYFKNKKVTLKCEVADNFLKRAFGIMFKRNFKPVLFKFEKKQNICIHSFFCPPFIAIFLNEKKKVIQIKKIDPFSIFTSKPANYLIEVPIRLKRYFR